MCHCEGAQPPKQSPTTSSLRQSTLATMPPFADEATCASRFRFPLPSVVNGFPCDIITPVVFSETNGLAQAVRPEVLR